MFDLVLIRSVKDRIIAPLKRKAGEGRKLSSARLDPVPKCAIDRYRYKSQVIHLADWT
jgi:hypothetical protein